MEIISGQDAQQLFSGTGMTMDLGIYKINLNKNEQPFNLNKLLMPCILKVINKLKNAAPIFEENQKDGNRVKISKIYSGKSGGSGNRTPKLRGQKFLNFNNGLRDGLPWWNFYQKNQHSKQTDEIPYSIKFETENNAINFVSSYNCNFPRFFTHSTLTDANFHPYNILWMENCINPRTGLKGYESEWTDEDFYTYFNITKEEQELIEKTIEKYT